MTPIAVTVVYALPACATEIEVSLAAGATVEDALTGSAIASRHPDVDFAHCPVGIFGKHVDRQTLVADGDRIELYRPLIADPKASRRQRAHKA